MYILQPSAYSNTLVTTYDTVLLPAATPFDRRTVLIIRVFSEATRLDPATSTSGRWTAWLHYKVYAHLWQVHRVRQRLKANHHFVPVTMSSLS